MHSYMVEKGHWGTYARTMEYSVGIFASKDPLAMARNSGTIYDPAGSTFLFQTFGLDITVSYPEGKVRFRGTDKSPIFGLSIPIVNYLVRADGKPLTGRLISYKELENGHVYYKAFQREAIDRLADWIPGKSPEILGAAISDLGGEFIGGADIACRFSFLPRFPVILKLWLPDDEMGASANILFDSSANSYLHTEDIAAAGELAARFLIRQYSLLSKSKQEVLLDEQCSL